MPTLDALRERVTAATEVCDELTEERVWGAHGPLVWRARRFVGSPSFYPIYRWRDCYSYSPLALLLTKGTLSWNAPVAATASRPDFMYYPGSETVDREIERIGGPPLRASGPGVTHPDEYAEKVAAALRADLGAGQERHPDKRHVVLCGGKDSLNLLLGPWKRPVLALSAPPNFEHVRDFVRANDLPHEVRRLDDPRDDAVLEREVLETCLRASLEHYRWGAHLQQISRELGGELVFWKGQVGDALTTPYWKTLCHPPSGLRRKLTRAYVFAEGAVPAGLRRRIERDVLEPYFRNTLWIRCAMFQGSHMSVIRAVSDCLVLSGYHGREMTRLVREVDFFDAVHEDIRPHIGRLLLGREVRYPAENPSPPPSKLRAGLSHPDRFLELLARERFPVQVPG